MKKVLLVLIMLFMGLKSYAAKDIMPYSRFETKNFGIGVMQVPNELTFYESADKKSKALAQIKFAKGFFSSTNITVTPQTIFPIYLPNKNLAYVNVLEEEDNFWYQVILNKITGKTAWVNLENADLYYTWREFYNLWGRKNGLYYLKNVPEAKKALYSSCDEKSQRLEDFDYPKFISVSAIRGNWAMVTVVDIGDSNKIGWLQWRNTDGELFLFPSVNKKY